MIQFMLPNILDLKSIANIDEHDWRICLPAHE